MKSTFRGVCVNGLNFLVGNFLADIFLKKISHYG